MLFHLKRGLLIQLFCLCLATLCSFVSVAHAQDDTSNITVSVTSPAPMPTVMAVGDTLYVGLTASLDSAPNSNDECTSGSPRGWQGTTYSWSGGTFVDSNGSPTTPTGANAILMVPVATTGNQNITVSVTSTTNSSCGTRSGSGSKTISILVVGVKNLQIAQQGQTFSDVNGEVIPVPSEKTRVFKAIPDPSGLFPSGKPVWGGTSGASGTGDTTSVTFYGVSSTMKDTQTISAECGNTVTANVIVFSNTLQHSSNWSSGNTYPSAVQAKTGTFPTYGVPLQGSAKYIDPNTHEVSYPSAYITFGETRADLLPYGIGPYLSGYLNIFNQYNSFVTFVDSNGTVGQPQPLGGQNQSGQTTGNTTNDDPFPASNIISYDSGNTLFINDSPGPFQSTLDDILKEPAIVPTKKVIITQNFKARLTYRGGPIGPLATWTVTTSATLNNDGSITYGQ